MKLRIKKGDQVQVISGSQKGKTGKVIEVMPKDLKVLIEGVNLMKKHVKPSQKNPQGGILAKEAPLHYSKVMLLDQSGKPTRIRMQRDSKGTAVRIAKTTGKPLTT